MNAECAQFAHFHVLRIFRSTTITLLALQECAATTKSSIVHLYSNTCPTTPPTHQHPKSPSHSTMSLIASPTRPIRSCAQCGTSSTAQWRYGHHNGTVLLCNACGIRHRRRNSNARRRRPGPRTPPIHKKSRTYDPLQLAPLLDLPLPLPGPQPKPSMDRSPLSIQNLLNDELPTSSTLQPLLPMPIPLPPVQLPTTTPLDQFVLY